MPSPRSIFRLLFVFGIIPFQGLRSGDCDCDCSGEHAAFNRQWNARKRGYANAVQAYAAINGPIIFTDPNTGEQMKLKIDDDLRPREHNFFEDGDRAFACYRMHADLLETNAERTDVAVGVCFPLLRKEEDVWSVDDSPVLLGRKPSTEGGIDDLEAFVRFRCPTHWLVQSHDPGTCYVCGAPLIAASASASANASAPPPPSTSASPSAAPSAPPATSP